MISEAENKLLTFVCFNLILLDFKISNKETVIKLGDDSILSLQRKGGDSGKKSSNQLQIKIIVSKIIHKVDHLHHTL